MSLENGVTGPPAQEAVDTSGRVNLSPPRTPDLRIPLPGLSSDLPVPVSLAPSLHCPPAALLLPARHSPPWLTAQAGPGAWLGWAELSLGQDRLLGGGQRTQYLPQRPLTGAHGSHGLSVPTGGVQPPRPHAVAPTQGCLTPSQPSSPSLHCSGQTPGRGPRGGPALRTPRLVFPGLLPARQAPRRR